MKLLNNLVRFGIPVIGIILISSCGSRQPLTVIPQAVNTVSTVTFSDLRLQRNDYDLINTVTADATINVEYRSDKITVNSVDDDFSLTYKLVNGVWTVDKYSGVARFGYLVNDDKNMSTSFYNPSEIVRQIAVYRLINNVQQNGADGLIEPTISTNVAQTGKHNVTYTTHAEGKLIRLKPNK